MSTIIKPSQKTCPACNGRGIRRRAYTKDEMVSCDECRGTGLILTNDTDKIEFERIKDSRDKLAKTLFIVLDEFRKYIGEFNNWPENLKEAYANAIIDHSPLLEEDIQRTHELIAEGKLRK